MIVKIDCNKLFRKSLRRINFYSILKISKIIGCRSLLNSLSIEDLFICWNLDKINNNWISYKINTNKLFCEILDLSNKRSEVYGQRTKFILPKWSWLLRLMLSDLNIYICVSTRHICCNTRKLISLEKELLNKNWFTGLRIAQSELRKINKIILWDILYNNIKLSPILLWNINQIINCILSIQVPYNFLQNIGFRSIGCAPCTRAVNPNENSRAGRWWWESFRKFGPECGLHRT
ncbi:Phosphoadenosine phosphosulfate reductase [Candidatus Hodgkinia cicadicola]|uniref:Phosphoadenosine phosphosulfate reductase n=1 Tax=Candidatus Hodgkinia cicadicola TaxID=573658 RepID=A0ABX4MI44_9HYPH|nr:Phosphoadenosine phosphosulfate reductase [Candidatus Hodgkinia cicadicola]